MIIGLIVAFFVVIAFAAVLPLAIAASVSAWFGVEVAIALTRSFSAGVLVFAAACGGWWLAAAALFKWQPWGTRDVNTQWYEPMWWSACLAAIVLIATLLAILFLRLARNAEAIADGISSARRHRKDLEATVKSAAVQNATTSLRTRHRFGPGAAVFVMANLLPLAVDVALRSHTRFADPIAAAIALSVFVISVMVLAHRRRTSLINEARRPVPQADAQNVSSAGRLPVGDQLWLTRSLIDTPTCAALASRHCTTSEQLAAMIASYSDGLSDTDRADAQRRADRLRLARQQRADLTVVLPTLQNTIYSSAPVLDVLLGQLMEHTSQQSVRFLTQHWVDAHIQAGHDGIIDTLAGGAHHGIHAVADAHIPILTIATSINRYHSAYSNGLDATTALTNGAVDVGSRAGGAVIGAHALGVFFPVVGHLVGAAVGGLLGGMFSREFIQKPLKDADQNLRDELDSAGRQIDPRKWAALSDLGKQTLADRRNRYTLLIREVDDTSPLTRRRRFWPSLTDLVLREAINTAKTEIDDETAEIHKFNRLLRTITNGDQAPTHIAAAAIVWPDLAAEFGINPTDITDIHTAIAVVDAERKKLNLQQVH